MNLSPAAENEGMSEELRQVVGEDFPNFNSLSLFPDQCAVWFNFTGNNGDWFLSQCSAEDCLIPFRAKIQFHDGTADKRTLCLWVLHFIRKIAP